MATLPAATAQTHAQRVLGTRAKGSQTEVTWDLHHHPKIHQAPYPGSTRDTPDNAYPEYGNADREMCEGENNERRRQNKVSSSSLGCKA